MLECRFFVVLELAVGLSCIPLSVKGIVFQCFSVVWDEFRVSPIMLKMIV